MYYHIGGISWSFLEGYIHKVSQKWETKKISKQSVAQKTVHITVHYNKYSTQLLVKYSIMAL